MKRVAQTLFPQRAWPCVATLVENVWGRQSQEDSFPGLVLPLLRNTDDFPNLFRQVAKHTAENHRCYPPFAARVQEPVLPDAGSAGGGKTRTVGTFVNSPTIAPAVTT